MIQRGFSYLELLVALTLLASVAVLGIPSWQQMGQRGALNAAALRLFAEAQRCQDLAARRLTHVGLLFDVDERGTFFVPVQDANGNGVSRRDYLTGRDPAVGQPVHLQDLGPWVRLGPPPGTRLSAPGGGRVPETGLAVGEARILSFSPGLGARSGSIYLFSGNRAVALRVSPTGVLRLFRWSASRGSWQPFRL